MRRDFTSSSLVARALELSCGFSYTSVCEPPIDVCSQGCPRAQEPTLVGMGLTREPVAPGVREPALEGGLPSALGDRVQCMRREGEMVAPPFLCHSTMVLLLCASSVAGFLQEHSQLWSSSIPSPQAFSLQPTAVLCSPNHTFQRLALSALVDTHLRLGHAGLWLRLSV